MADRPDAAPALADPDLPPPWTEQDLIDAAQEASEDVAAGRIVEWDDLRDELAAMRAKPVPP